MFYFNLFQQSVYGNDHVIYHLRNLCNPIRGKNNRVSRANINMDEWICIVFTLWRRTLRQNRDDKQKIEIECVQRSKYIEYGIE